MIDDLCPVEIVCKRYDKADLMVGSLQGRARMHKLSNGVKKIGEKVREDRSVFKGSPLIAAMRRRFARPPTYRTPTARDQPSPIE